MTKRSDMKEIARPENGTSSQEFNLCRSISTTLFSRYKLTSFMILKVKEGATAD
jgi:hypothetical protein